MSMYEQGSNPVEFYRQILQQRWRRGVQPRSATVQICLHISQAYAFITSSWRWQCIDRLLQAGPTCDSAVICALRRSASAAMSEAAGTSSKPVASPGKDDARKEKLRKAGQEYFEKVLAQVCRRPVVVTLLNFVLLTSSLVAARTSNYSFPGNVMPCDMTPIDGCNPCSGTGPLPYGWRWFHPLVLFASTTHHHCVMGSRGRRAKASRQCLFPGTAKDNDYRR